jgi:hypothetical protein
LRIRRDRPTTPATLTCHPEHASRDSALMNGLRPLAHIKGATDMLFLLTLPADASLAFWRVRQDAHVKDPKASGDIPSIF